MTNVSENQQIADQLLEEDLRIDIEASERAEYLEDYINDEQE